MMTETIIHMSQGPNDTPVTYIIVSRKWKTMVTVLVYIGLVFAVALTIAIYENIVRINKTERVNSITKQRHRAIDDIISERGKIQEWMYNELCERAKKEGRKCLDNPQWWADPIKYPDLVNHEYGIGLFGKNK